MFRIIIAEDEPLILQSIAQKIREADPDFKVVGEYENGEFALLELDLVKPHILLTDIYMPVMDGLLLIERAKEQHPTLLCAVLTGYRDFEYAHKAIQLGVTDFLLKPPTVDNLSEFLHKAKAKLLDNQSLIEAELLQQWAYQKSERTESEQIQMLAQEYYYHASYTVLLAWMPPQLENGWKEYPNAQRLKSMLNEGESFYTISVALHHQRAVVIGCHNLTEARLQQFLEVSMDFETDRAICFAAAKVDKLQAELSWTLYQLQKVASRNFPLQGKQCIVFTEGDQLNEPQNLPLSSVWEEELGELLAKKRKSEFLRKLQVVLESEPWSSSTRVRWLQSLTDMMKLWLVKHKELSRLSAIAHWNSEIEELIWQAEDYSDVRNNVIEAFDSLFETSDDQRETETSWTLELKLYLEQNYMRNISLSDLAEKFGLNPSYLGRMFKRQYQHTPIDYLIQIRIDIAKRLIREKPRLLFKDVAEMVGYNDPFYFSKIFKQLTGLTPREYKRQFS